MQMFLSTRSYLVFAVSLSMDIIADLLMFHQS